MNATIDPRPAREIALHTGLAEQTVHNLISRYNRFGPKAVEGKGKGGRRRSYMTWEEEKKFLNKYLKKGLPMMKEPKMLARSGLFLIIMFFISQVSWSAEPMLWPSTSLRKVLVSDMPDENTPSVLKLSGARGENVSGQAVFSPGNDVEAATVSITDLSHKSSGKKIPASAVKLQWVRYINVQKNSSRIPWDELEIKAPNPMPDPYWEDLTIPIKYGTYSILDNSIYILYRSQPVWIEIHVPRDVAPGDYTGTLKVTGSSKPVELPVELHVWNFEVPNDRHLAVIYWGGFPSGMEPYTGEYWEQLKKNAEFLVEHRQTEMGLLPMRIIRDKGNGKYDTSVLEKFAEVVFETGIRRIHLHGCGKHRNITDTDKVSGVGGSVLNRNVIIVANEEGFARLPALEEMTKRRGWVGRFLVAISDEPFMHHEESFTEVVEQMNKIAPTIKTIDAVEAEYLGNLSVYCPKINHLDMWWDTYKEHQRNGSELWFYTSRIPIGIYPTRFIDTSLLKYRVQFWMEYLCDLDGYLHCAVGPSTGNPYSERGVAPNSPLGNNIHAYPGKDGYVGSIRYSTVRDGLEDFEYMWVLEDRLQKLKERVGEDAHWLKPRQRSLELCRRVCWSLHDYTRDPQLMLDTRNAIAEEIEALDTEPLLYVQTSPMEGSVFPEGPRNLGIRGLVQPGAKVTINDDPVDDIRPSGYFRRYHFLLDVDPVITITVEYKGKKRTVTRTFNLTN